MGWRPTSASAFYPDCRMSPRSTHQALRLEFRHYQRPFELPLVTAHGVWTERTGVIVRLEHASGAAGFGEIAPVPGFGDTPEPDLAELQALLGKFHVGQLKGIKCPFLRWALECALSQIEDPTLPGVRVPVAGLLPAGEAALAALPAQMATGRRAFKWKIGVTSADEELAIADRLVAAMPKGVRLRFDANGGLGSGDYAAWLKWCADHRQVVDYLEQPLPVGDEDDLVSWADSANVPVALDESVAGVESLNEMANRYPRAVLIIKPSLLGSRTAYLRWRNANGQRRVVYSSCFETAVGLKAVWELAALDWPPLSPAGLDTVSNFTNDGLCPIRIGWEISSPDWPQGVEQQVWNAL